MCASSVTYRFLSHNLYIVTYSADMRAAIENQLDEYIDLRVAEFDSEDSLGSGLTIVGENTPTLCFQEICNCSNVLESGHNV